MGKSLGDDLNIVLIGFRGTGKTTIGRELAKRLDKEFIDADEFLERREGRTIKDIFNNGGEPVFRNIEAKVIAELSLLDDKVIATGGGVVLRGENMDKLKKNGIVILLYADVDVIYKRISKDALTEQRRPRLTNLDRYQEIKHLLEIRKPLYDVAANFRLNTGNTPVMVVVDKAVSIIQNYMVDLKDVK